MEAMLEEVLAGTMAAVAKPQAMAARALTAVRWMEVLAQLAKKQQRAAIAHGLPACSLGCVRSLARQAQHDMLRAHQASLAR